MNPGSNRRLIWVIAVTAIIILAAGLFLHYSVNKHAPLYTQKVVDSCTGQTYTITPNQGTEKFNSSNPNVLIGGSAILNAGATQSQYQTIQQVLAQYLQKNLGGRYGSLTVAPHTLTARPGSAEINVALCLGLSSNRVNATMKLTQLRYVQVVIKDPTGHNGGDFDSGVLDSTPQSPHGL